jgi:ubiquinone/menaquinone biosynthesis C-methylase UbiE
MESKQKVCPVEQAGHLESSLRKFLQDPNKILAPHLKPGMTMLDLGCGPGYFSIEAAKILGNKGKLIAADLQDGMLDKVWKKIRGTELEDRIKLHKCKPNSMDLNEKVDFALGFFMVHEVPDKRKLFLELKSILKPGAKMLIVEPKFHVSAKEYAKMLDYIFAAGLSIDNRKDSLLTRSLIIKN